MFERGSEEFTFFTDFWNLCKKYWEPQESDEWWQQYLDDADRFNKKYESFGILPRLLTDGLVQWFESKLKGSGKNE